MAANNADDARMEADGQPPVAPPQQGNGSSGPKAGACWDGWMLVNVVRPSLTTALI